ncbi:hypothetical protein S140_205 [Shewanella sp. phage 1/40]|uniref:hypothetical protein n=1 Tax=Shewanella sp. phage 1/40 TaxID=1458860 RepID=UPI0004F63A79|nr:hypothetical protein S140_205 [Shewanella sp. phage 1/40]AHK11612.1 hypothetical protein S140_205 [Shewanella sp. phage 1/40]
MTQYITNYTRGCFIHWSTSHAIAEAVANALDSDGELSFDFGGDYISLTNKDIKVSNKMLMSGLSDKRYDDSKRGRHGIGIIQAMVVLTDQNINVSIYNNDIVWRPEFQYSSQFDADIMVINESPFDNGTNFTVIIEGLSPQDIDEVKQRCLVFQDREVLHSTEYGDIISKLEDEEGGEVFCGDMYVCQNKNFKYSYNFKPKGIKLSQDRDAVSQWDLQQLTAKLIIATKDDDFIKEAIKANKADTEYVNTVWTSSAATSDSLDDSFADEFLSEHGAKLVTSSYSDHQANEKAGNKSVYIDNARIVTAISSSTLYQSAMESFVEVERETFSELLLKTLERMEELLYSNGLINYTEQNTDKPRTGDNEIVDWLDEIKDRVDNEYWD